MKVGGEASVLGGVIDLWNRGEIDWRKSRGAMTTRTRNYLHSHGGTGLLLKSWPGLGKTDAVLREVVAYINTNRTYGVFAAGTKRVADELAERARRRGARVHRINGRYEDNCIKYPDVAWTQRQGLSPGANVCKTCPCKPRRNGKGQLIQVAGCEYYADLEDGLAAINRHEPVLIVCPWESLVAWSDAELGRATYAKIFQAPILVFDEDPTRALVQDHQLDLKELLALPPNAADATRDACRVLTDVATTLQKRFGAAHDDLAGRALVDALISSFGGASCALDTLDEVAASPPPRPKHIGCAQVVPGTLRGLAIALAVDVRNRLTVGSGAGDIAYLARLRMGRGYSFVATAAAKFTRGQRIIVTDGYGSRAYMSKRFDRPFSEFSANPEMPYDVTLFRVWVKGTRKSLLSSKQLGPVLDTYLPMVSRAEASRRVLTYTFSEAQAEVERYMASHSVGVERTPEYYGSGRGKDGYADLDTVILVGDYLPPPATIQHLANYDAVQLAVQTGNGAAPRRIAPAVRNGQRTSAQFGDDADPRLREHLHRIARDEMGQAMHRVRLIQGRLRRVFLFGNQVPVADDLLLSTIPITTGATRVAAPHLGTSDEMARVLRRIVEFAGFWMNAYAYVLAPLTEPEFLDWCFSRTLDGEAGHVQRICGGALRVVGAQPQMAIEHKSTVIAVPSVIRRMLAPPLDWRDTSRRIASGEPYKRALKLSTLEPSGTLRPPGASRGRKANVYGDVGRARRLLELSFGDVPVRMATEMPVPVPRALLAWGREIARLRLFAGLAEADIIAIERGNAAARIGVLGRVARLAKRLGRSDLLARLPPTASFSLGLPAGVAQAGAAPREPEPGGYVMCRPLS